MALPVPILDNRTFQDIVDEAKKRIVASCPEWTDHNVSDPGVTLIELFAWMTEMIIYRLNQVPQLNYIKFLELLGLALQEPEPAQGQITFYLSKATLDEKVIPESTEVATIRTETQPPIIFSTAADFVIRPAQLKSLITSVPAGNDREPHYYPLDHRYLEHTPAFDSNPNGDPQDGSALCFGFETDLSHHVIAVNIQCDEGAPGGIEPENPPWQWEGGWLDDKNEPGWRPAVLEEDTTKGMSQSGRVMLRLPNLTQTEVNGQRAYWVRCRVVETDYRRNYDRSPRLNRVKVESWGATIQATHAAIITNEHLGYSDGSPGQRFQTENSPLLKREHKDDVIEIKAPDRDEWEAWRELSHFAHTTDADKIYTCDGATGEIRFGPALMDRTGAVRTYGALPPRGSQIRFRQYRYGGGIKGNVQPETLTVLKTSIPYIDRVTNYNEARGGVDQESIELAKLRAPKRLSAGGRAVTASDYETLVKEATRDLARVHCLQTTTNSDIKPGTVCILLVPNVNRPVSPITQAQLTIDHLRHRIETYLDKYRLLTVKLDVREPDYVWVSTEVTVTAQANADPDRLYDDIQTQLYRFLNPILGGPAGTGWPFGRPLSLFDISTCLQQVPGIDFIQSLKLYQVKQGGTPNETREDVGGSLTLDELGLIVSAEHRVIVNRMG